MVASSKSVPKAKPNHHFTDSNKNKYWKLFVSPDKSSCKIHCGNNKTNKHVVLSKKYDSHECRKKINKVGIE